ncbi:hypothetical protein DFQ26_004386, partial [Actinomortierella ambigua]
MPFATSIVLSPERAPIPPATRRPSSGTDPPPMRLPFQQLVDSEKRHWQNDPNQTHFQYRLDEAMMELAGVDEQQELAGVDEQQELADKDEQQEQVGFLHALHSAVTDSMLKDNKENSHRVIVKLLEHGLVIDHEDRRSSFASFVKTTFLGTTSDYCLRIASGGQADATATTVDCPTRSLLLFQHLATELCVRIFLFSNRASPRVYSPEQKPKMTVAFLHLVDSFMGTGEYLCLKFANHKTRRTMRRQSHHTPTASSSRPHRPGPPGSVAKFRKEKRGRSASQSIDHSDERMQVLGTALEAACCLRVEKKINDKLEPFFVKSKKRKRGQDSAPAVDDHGISKVREALREQFANVSKAPRGLYKDAMAIHIRATSESTNLVRFSSEIPDAISLLTNKKRARRFKSPPDDALTDGALNHLFWVNTVTRNYDDIWTRVLNDKMQHLSTASASTGPSLGNNIDNDDDGGDDDDGDGDDSDAGDAKVETRTCTATLKQLLREDLAEDPDIVARIIECSELHQAVATDFEDQLYTLVHKATLAIGSGSLSGDNPTPFDLQSLFPDADPIPDELRWAHVAPIRSEVQDMIESSVEKGEQTELVGLFTQRHLNALALHFTSDGDSDMKLNIDDEEDGSPSLWIRLSRQIRSQSTCPPLPSRGGTSKTLEAHTRQCATMLKNLWSGDIYDKSLSYLLRFTLRARLASRRELEHRERKAKYAADKKTKQDGQETRHGEEYSPSRWRHAMRKLCDKLADAEQRVNSVRGHESACRRRDTLLEQIAILGTKNPGQLLWVTHPILPLDSSSFDEVDEDDSGGSGQADDENEANVAVLAQLAQEALDTKLLSVCPSGDCGSSMSERLVTSPASAKPENVEPKEPSRRRLLSLQAILKILLESPSSLREFTLQDVESCAFQDHDFTPDELNVVLDLANKFRRFMPRRWLNKDGDGYRHHHAHVALRAPIVLLANAVMRARGYTEFARRICPHVATGDLNALQVGPQQLFDALCSASERHFDVLDANGKLLTN